ncbi:hypothetical protein J8L98_01395 [Pseudoalteromonas sp. MMG013]|uniref:hypothetical protein n=1 Tax=Pseudoalteromonas sp. MMG013 TaxID=2822687 RepID=UPI001B35A88E|nr:hypothetical protein [Pseudoalteromonas sp. MMG013]MBQ4860343.1 hypothetical protein [Pseudoalteromonas sp. MMG013]
MNPMMAATGIPGFSNGAQSPISSSASSATGDQTQNIGFTGHGVTFGGGSNNQLLIIGGLALAALFLLKK